MRAVGSQIFGHDLKREGVFHVLISAIGWHVDRAREAPWPVARASSSASESAWNTMRFDPTRSRRQGEPVLQTYGEGNGQGRAGDDSVVQSVLGDGEDGLRWCSGFKGVCWSFLVRPIAPNGGGKLKFGVFLGFSGFLTCGEKNHTVGCTIYRGFLDRIVDSKYSSDFLVQIRLYLAKIWKES
jgi:hypothetical protein